MGSFTERSHLDLESNQSAGDFLCGDLAVLSRSVLATEHTNYKRRITMNRLRKPVSRLALALLSLIIFAVSISAQSSATAADGWVVLPVSEYAALKHAAAPAEPEPVAPPVEAT